MNPFIYALHQFDPEVAHNLTLALLKTNLLPDFSGGDDPSLNIDVWGKKFSNPVGLAAGFDKNAEVIVPMLKLGFGFVEVGTVTPKAQIGNPKPRLFRWAGAKAVINRFGFNNLGLDNYCQNIEHVMAHQLRRVRVLGGNVGKNKDSTDAVADYVKGIRAIAPLVDYITINISSPNTPGLRGLQNRDELNELLQAAQAERAQLKKAPPMLVKIAPDLDEAAIADIAAVLMENRVDGAIVSNTTISRPADMPANLVKEAGGLSGPPVLEKANTALSLMAKHTGKKLPLIGVGGISSAEDAYQKIRLGASLVQIYTGLVYQGPSLLWQIRKQLPLLLKRDGFVFLKDAVGVDIKL